MKNTIYLFLLITSFGFAQTPIDNFNLKIAIDSCLSTNPKDGLCYDSEYGAMPDWDVSDVTEMSGAFFNKSTFNGDISLWDVSNVVYMNGAFAKASSFNQDIGNWDVSKVMDMEAIFSEAKSFNQDLSTWDVSNVVDMNGAFVEAESFDQDISSWDVSSVVDMSWMFMLAKSFDNDISSWDVSNVEDMSKMFSWSGLTTETYDLILKGWSTQDLNSNVNFEATTISYCSSEAERQSIIDEFNWTISDAGMDCTPVKSIDSKEISLSVFPSPTIGPITVEFNNSERGVLKIYGPAGRLLQSLQVDESDRLNYELDGMPGIYLVEFLSETGAVFVGKVLKVD